MRVAIWLRSRRARVTRLTARLTLLLPVLARQRLRFLARLRPPLLTLA
jgi:hypothetical protein